jgi:hypothetical protein
MAPDPNRQRSGVQRQLPADRLVEGRHHRGGGGRGSEGLRRYGDVPEASTTSYAQQPIFFTTSASVISAKVYYYKNAGSAAGYCDDYTLVRLP